MFEKVIHPLIDVGSKQLDMLLATYPELVAPIARAGLIAHLTQRVTMLLSPTLRLKFAVFCVIHEPMSTALPEDISSHPCYPDFVLHMQEHGVFALLHEFPVLGTLVYTITQFWLESIAELLQRLKHDLHIIQDSLCKTVCVGQMSHISAGLSDAHQQGRTVMCLTFTSGMKIIYKPRDLGMEKAWFDMLHWFNQQQGMLPLKILRVLPQHGYGWMEYAEELACSDELSVQRSYYRAGMLLCLLYLMQATDMHPENLICCGEHPVLIDLECLLQPHTHGHRYTFTPVRFDETVLRTHFLPSWEGTEDQRIFGKFPSLNGKQTEPMQYLADFDAGFCDMYRFLLTHRACLIGSDSPLHVLEHTHTRPIFRDTSNYLAVIQRSLQPELLRNPDERHRVLATLLTIQTTEQTKTLLEPRYQAEIRAASYLDIPRFTCEANTTNLILPQGESINNYFAIAPMDEVRHRILHLSEDDMACQRYLIHGSFVFRQHAHQSICSEHKHFIHFVKLAPTFEEKPHNEPFIETACTLAEYLRTMAVTTVDGSSAWITTQASDERRVYRFKPCDYFLYEGNVGIALFLAAVDKVCGLTQYRDLVCSILAPLHKHVRSLSQHTAIGAAHGLGGLIYAIVCISDFLKEPALLEIAHNIATHITLERIQKDTQFDIFNGSAGAILGLLNLYQATADQTILAQSFWCGEHLIQNRSVSDSEYRAWKTLDGMMLSGMAHGAAGIAYSMLRLFDTTKYQPFRDCAIEAIAFERTRFLPEAGNWRSFGSPSHQPIFWTSFCHGAPGIGLARLGCLATLDTPEIREEIAIALHTTITGEPSAWDFLCCGNMGRNDVMLEAGLRLNDPDLLRIAREKTAHLVNRSRIHGTFNLFPDLPPTIQQPGFFKGIAGIGYGLLRVAYPGILPCVLLWE